MISRIYNLNSALNARPRWSGCLRSNVRQI